MAKVKKRVNVNTVHWVPDYIIRGQMTFGERGNWGYSENDVVVLFEFGKSYISDEHGTWIEIIHKPLAEGAVC